MQKTIEIEVAVIGGATAGLAAALTLGRCMRNAIVFDTGSPRNKPAAHAHNFFTRDGTPPSELLRIAREQLVLYPSVQVEQAAILSAAAENGRFILQADNGHTYRAQRVVIATGVKDDLPAIPGVAELWGSKLFHCPYCHGWEVKDLPVALFGSGEMAYEFTRLLYQLNKDLVICTNGPAAFTKEQLQSLARRHIKVLEEKVAKVEDAPGGIQITFSDGTVLHKSAAYVKTSLVYHTELAVQLGCELTEQGSIKVNGLYETSVAGVLAAGDVSGSTPHQVSAAAASGHMAGAMCNNGLAKEAFEEQ
ncbi:NAD(P)/FAD-dependent oxidoreductase [Chitinophaga alhagiae]|uniref:NAD(P)/FAD-dependent oxidoreductase n=1 Tax=Chitinophaga alhagiae TaxID=2203219 RepID=UPI000E5C37C8|nr:NAD(P)/FAD-dependent oxidoreductase [Chitinophaga alhagiae]